MKLAELEKLGYKDAKAYFERLLDEIEAGNDESLETLAVLMAELDDLKSRQITGENDGKI